MSIAPGHRNGLILKPGHRNGLSRITNRHGIPFPGNADVFDPGLRMKSALTSMIFSASGKLSGGNYLQGSSGLTFSATGKLTDKTPASLISQALKSEVWMKFNAFGKLSRFYRNYGVAWMVFEATGSLTEFLAALGYGRLYNWFAVDHIGDYDELVTGWTNVSWDTFTSSGENISEMTADSSGQSLCYSNELTSLSASQVLHFKIDLTVNSGDPPYLWIQEDGADYIFPLAAGVNIFRHKCSATVSSVIFRFINHDFINDPGVYHDIDCGMTFRSSTNNFGGIAPEGFHVPTRGEYESLLLEIDPTFNPALAYSTTAGTHLKESGEIHWSTSGGDNTSGFTARGAGFRYDSDGTFSSLMTTNFLWALSHDIGIASALNLFAGSGLAAINDYGESSLKTGGSLRCLKDFTDLAPGETGSVTDIDGNEYPTICIGTQEWMASSLKTTKYSDGNSIPEEIDNSAWAALSTGARCNYNNDINNV